MSDEWDLITGVEVLGAAESAACLVVVATPTRQQLGRVLVLSKSCSLGRGDEADVRLDDSAMSRRHVELLVKDGCVTVRDLGSRNGTWHNGVKVTEATLRDGDRLKLGGTLLHFHAPTAEKGEPWPSDALEQAGVALWECAVPARLIRFSRHADAALGLPPGTLPREPTPLGNVLHPADRADTRWLDVASVDRDVRLHIGGQERWVHLRGQRATRAGGTERFTGTAIDVTVAHQREEAVARHGLVFENLADPVLVTDVNGRAVDLNSAAMQVFGVSRAEAQGRELFGLVGAREPELLGPAVLGVLSVSGRWTAELPLATASGPLFFEALGFHLKENGEVVGAAWLFRDVSERRRLEARLNHIDRLASLGTMSAGIAHELNNPLSYVLANARFVLERLGDGADPDVREALGELQQGALRIAAIVGDLRTFSRSDTQLETQPTDVAQVVDAALRVTAKLVNARAHLTVQVDGVPQVEAFEPRLVQVVVNLLINAAQAIPEGNEKTGHITVRAAADGDGVALEVIDDGVGMTPEVQQRVFDPFFTTRPVGFGSGLGLAVCHGLVTAMGGTLSVHSAPGQGSTFRVWLKRAQARSLATSTPVPLGVSDKPLRVLMVDDEPMVLKALGRILRQHEVTQALCVADALARLDAGESYDVVLCDLMMPERSGMDLYEDLRERAPALLDRVIFLTGGAFTERAERFLKTVPNKQLCKPVDAALLRQVVREVGASS
ncbi:MAG: ATP-binding protein [Myxococcota bacterium]